MTTTVNYNRDFPGAVFAQARGKMFLALYKQSGKGKPRYVADVRWLSHDARREHDDYVDFRGIDTIDIPNRDAIRAIRHVERKGCVFDVLTIQ